jgi:hypothetical protein
VSDLHASIAVVHAGCCPLCGHPLDTTGLCDPCDAVWTISSVRDPIPDGGEAYGGMGPMLSVSRKLTPDEVKKLYNRTEAT